MELILQLRVHTSVEWIFNSVNTFGNENLVEQD